jgi:hypothetical protein
MTDIEAFDELEAATLQAVDIMRGYGVAPSQAKRFLREYVDMLCESAQIEAEIALETCQRVNRMEFRP